MSLLTFELGTFRYPAINRFLQLASLFNILLSSYARDVVLFLVRLGLFRENCTIIQHPKKMNNKNGLRDLDLDYIISEQSSHLPERNMCLESLNCKYLSGCGIDIFTKK
ncbi:uncharacterized protein Gasu_45910 [Galdieria sulphuraria]|uniref:Uncharacterized protein n=1 Tax=Galdieria sulphuraria TaxID=130081 RepID=M2XWZ1_GALSU|nr:uncharacterized protein Gasu_45910 [Galdieria sulphuraria]EME27929.1 hypothetical protein Gasu_45910 [Galdieria sulphuraria]|eukprot:XP_005704449.1 hypothetical protein Gasu_45910 [Galdieria sulphuraria]